MWGSRGAWDTRMRMYVLRVGRGCMWGDWGVWDTTIRMYVLRVGKGCIWEIGALETREYGCMYCE